MKRATFTVEVGGAYVKIKDEDMDFEINTTYNSEIPVDELDIARHFNFFFTERNKALLRRLDRQLKRD